MRTSLLFMALFCLLWALIAKPLAQFFGLVHDVEGQTKWRW